MKKHFLYITLFSVAFMYGCNRDNHNHHEHNYHDHNHDSEHIHQHRETEEEYHHENGHSHSHSNINIDEDEDIVVFSHKQAENAGLNCDTINYAPFAHVIKCSGDIVSSPSDAIYIVAPTNGVILFGNPYPVDGKRVKAGEVLFNISSANLQDGDVAYKTKIAYENAKSDYERAAELAKEMIVSAKDLADIKDEYESAKAAYEAICGKDGNGSVVSAHTDGYISQISVKNGDFVSVGQTIAMISRNKKLQLRADIEREDFAHLPKITTANFTLSFDNNVYKLSEMNGKLLSYGKYITHGENFIPITFEFDNIANLIPGSYADIFLITASEDNCLAVPENAICEDEGLLFVFTRIDCEHFRKTYIEIGERNGEKIKVLKGLNNGDVVVTDGVHQLKAASRKSVIPEGHSHNH